MGAECERCGQHCAAAELELDVTGKFGCRRCRALIAVARADHSLTEQGVVRTCGRCGRHTLRPEVETYSVPRGVTDDREVRFTLGFYYRCDHCSARSWFFRPGVLAVYVVASLVLLAGMLLIEPTAHGGRGWFRFSMGKELPWWTRLFVLLIPLTLVGYDWWQRRRNPPA